MTYTNETPGKRGQTRISYRVDNPRSLIAQICSENPGLDIDELISLATEALLDPRYRSALAEYYATNQVRAYRDNETGRKHERSGNEEIKAAKEKSEEKEKSGAKEKKTAAVKTLVADGIEKAKLLGLLAPNGKPLAKCTFAECKQFGGWYLRLAKGHTDAETVGSCYSETQLRKLQTWKD
jgi:hypothetical protein